MAQAAAKLCERISGHSLLNHCYRTYAFGTLLGRRRRLSFNPEMLFVASMLHDVGLTGEFKQGSDTGLVPGYERKDAPCFAVRGADVARGLTTNNGWSASRSDSLAEAITIHVNVRVASSRGVVGHLLNAGSAFDVLRLGSHELPPEWILSVESQWPRGKSFCQDMWMAWACEAGAHRGCRGAFLDAWGLERRLFRTCRQRT